MVSASVRHRLQSKEAALSPYASRSDDSHGRDVPEEQCLLRTEFQRDRDRIVHSKSFRRLKHKTQVFIAPTGDHFVTRLTHTLEVAQIARTISRALNLNEDLTEAIALGHDIGHTPFGHIGEDEINSLHPDGFRHAEQSLRTIEKLEKDGSGLNLTREVRHGIVSHSKPRGDVMGGTVDQELSLEGQVCRLADAIAYLNHDLEDAFRSNIIDQDDLPSNVTAVLGKRRSLRIHTMISDIVIASWATTGEQGFDLSSPSITMSREVRKSVNSLRDFMFERVYDPEDRGEEGQSARAIVRLLYNHFHANREQIPPEYGKTSRSVVDYIAGMTDQYALRMAEGIRPGITQIFQRGLA